MTDENVGEADLLEGAIPEIAPVIAGELEGLGINLQLGEDGSVSVGPARGRREEEPPPEREDRRPPEEDEGGF